LHERRVIEVPAALFRDFAKLEARDVSPLYEQLASHVATRPSLRRMLGAAPPRQRRATLFFAAVHDVVLEQGGRYPLDGPTLEAFCAVNRAAILERIETRRTQTNEVARSAQLVLALARVTELAGGPPSLLEVGASAGLNLSFDDYRYTYRTRNGPVNVGAARARVHVDVTFEGDVQVIPAALPVVGERIGLDSHPVDVTDPVQRRWLRACVWADEKDRDRRLLAAMDRARRDPPSVIRGDAVADIEAVAAQLPPEVPLVVMHQVVMGYLSTSARTRFRRKVLGLGRQRPVYWLFAESPTAVQTLAGVIAPSGDGHLGHTLVLTDLTRDPPWSTVLAVADPHGSWLRWLGSSKSP
jgi:hypothetical protein